MSTALSKAIYARLAGTEVLTGSGGAAQTELAGLLATDPDTGRPAVFFGNKNQTLASDGSGNLSPLFPCVTFRPNGGAVDRRFARETGAVERVLYDFEVWESGVSGLTITEIAERVERLLDVRRGAIGLSLESGQAFHCEAFVPLQVVYDVESHAWAGVLRYAFVEARF